MELRQGPCTSSDGLPATMYTNTLDTQRQECEAPKRGHVIEQGKVLEQPAMRR